MRPMETIAQFDCTSCHTRAHSVTRTQTAGRTSSQPSLLCLILISRSRCVSLPGLFFSFFLKKKSLFVFNSRAKSCVCNMLLFFLGFFFICFWCPSYSLGINHLLIACTCSKHIRSYGRALHGDCCALNILSKKTSMGLFLSLLILMKLLNLLLLSAPFPVFSPVMSQ